MPGFFFLLANSQYSHQLDISGHSMGSNRLGKTEDCGSVKVPPAEAIGWGGSILHVWSRGKCSVGEEHSTQRELWCTANNPLRPAGFQRGFQAELPRLSRTHFNTLS